MYSPSVVISAMFEYGVWTDISSYVLDGTLRAEWGMNSNDPTDRIAATGVLSFSLKNSTGEFSPDLPATRTGWRKGTRIKLVMTYEEDGKQFYGKVDKITLSGGISAEQKAHVTVLDWMEDAAKLSIENPALLQNITADDAIRYISERMPAESVNIITHESNPSLRPANYELDLGTETFQTVFDVIGSYTKAYTELSKLANSEVGYVYLKKDKTFGETLVFENAERRNGLRTPSSVSISTAFYLQKEDGGYILTENGDKIILNNEVTGGILVEGDKIIADDVTYGNKLANHVSVQVYPKKIDTSTVLLYSMEQPVYFGASEQKYFKVRFTNEQGGNVINAIPPVNDEYTKVLFNFDGRNYEIPHHNDKTGRKWLVDRDDSYIVTNVVKLGTGSLYFDGSGAFINTPSSDNFNFYDGDFTVEYYLYRFNKTLNSAVTVRDCESPKSGFAIGVSNGTEDKCYMSSDGVAWDIVNGASMGPTGIAGWVHYAVVRKGNEFRVFREGIMKSSWTSSASLYPSTADLTIAKNNGVFLTACLDEFRITKGRAVYWENFTPPIIQHQLEGIFAQMWTGKDETGTNISDDLTITTTYGTAGADVLIANGATGGWLTSLKIYGYGIYSNSSIDTVKFSQNSINTHGTTSIQIQQPYQQTLYSGRVEIARILEAEKNPRTVLNKVTMNANKSDVALRQFLRADIGDLVHIKNDTKGIDGYYYINGVSFDMVTNDIINYTWKTRQAFTWDKGLTPFAVEFAGSGSEDAIEFDYMPIIFGDKYSIHAFSAWINVDTIPTDNNYEICGNLSDASGMALFLRQDESSIILACYSRMTGTAGLWSCPADAFSTGADTHILLYYNYASAKPLIFINGALQVLTTDISPSGDINSTVGNNFIIGNINNVVARYTQPFDGIIKDVRIYAFSSPPDSVTELAVGLSGEGAYGRNFTDNLKFQAFAVYTKNATLYTDLPLNEESKLLDEYLGYVGTPHPSVSYPITPTARAI